MGGTETLTATVAPADATNKTVSWSSSAPGVASVNNGTVSAVAAGTATITVTTADGAKTATCVVTVNAATGSGNGAITITPPGATEADPVLSVSPAEPTNGYTSDFTITAPAGYDSYKWLLDGTVQSGRGNSVTVPVSGLSNGNHSVTVVVVRTGKTYSATRNFKVSN